MAQHRFFQLVPVLACILCGAGAAPAFGAPPNDDFRDASRIDVGQTIGGTTVGATHEPGEPQHGPGTAAAVWYRFRSARRVTVLLNTCRTEADPVIAVYTGRSVRSFRLIDFNDDGCPALGSRVSFTARPGRTYRIAVAEYDATDRGRFRLGAKALDVPPNDDLVDAIPISLGSPIQGTTRNATLELGEPILDPHTVWFRLRVPAPTSVVLNACALSPDPHLAVFTGREVNRLRRVPAQGSDCRREYAAKPNSTYRVQVSHSGRGGRFRLTAHAATPAP